MKWFIASFIFMLGLLQPGFLFANLWPTNIPIDLKNRIFLQTPRSKILDQSGFLFDQDRKNGVDCTWINPSLSTLEPVVKRFETSDLELKPLKVFGLDSINGTDEYQLKNTNETLYIVDGEPPSDEEIEESVPTDLVATKIQKDPKAFASSECKSKKELSGASKRKYKRRSKLTSEPESIPVQASEDVAPVIRHMPVSKSIELFDMDSKCTMKKALVPDEYDDDSYEQPSYRSQSESHVAYPQPMQQGYAPQQQYYPQQPMQHTYAQLPMYQSYASQPIYYHQPMMQQPFQQSYYQNQGQAVAIAMQLQAQAMNMQAQASSLMMQAQPQQMMMPQQPMMIAHNMPIMPMQQPYGIPNSTQASPYNSQQPSFENSLQYKPGTSLVARKNQKTNYLMSLLQTISQKGEYGLQRLLWLIDLEFEIMEQLLAGMGGYILEKSVQERDIELKSSPMPISDAYNIIIELATSCGDQKTDQMTYGYLVRKSKRNGSPIMNGKSRKGFLMRTMNALEHYYTMIQNMDRAFH